MSSQAIDPKPPAPIIEQTAEPVFESHSLKDSVLAPGFNRLDPRQITAEIVSGTILSTVFTIIGTITSLVAWFAVDQILHWYLVSAGIGVVLLWLWFMTLFWPKREFNYASWKLDEIGLEIRKGVLWRHRITVPRARIQHVDVSQGPVQRNFGLAELTIHTAGTQNSSVKLEGLSYPVAIQLRDELITNREFGDAV